MLCAREHCARKIAKREVEGGLGPLMDAGLNEVRKIPREAKGVAGLGERGEGE